MLFCAPLPKALSSAYTSSPPSLATRILFGLPHDCVHLPTASATRTAPSRCSMATKPSSVEHAPGGYPVIAQTSSRSPASGCRSATSMCPLAGTGGSRPLQSLSAGSSRQSTIGPAASGLAFIVFGSSDGMMARARYEGGVLSIDAGAAGKAKVHGPPAVAPEGAPGATAADSPATGVLAAPSAAPAPPSADPAVDGDCVHAAPTTRARGRRSEIGLEGVFTRRRYPLATSPARRSARGKRRRLRLHTASNNPAAPWPPPMHIVTTARLPPRRRSS